MLTDQRGDAAAMDVAAADPPYRLDTRDAANP
jgi:hypothetical protein